MNSSCQNFKIDFLGQVWECGFAFENNPAIEIVRDVEKHILYEKPFFSFEATGDLATAIEIEFVRAVCSTQPIKIYQDNILVWNGAVRISDVENVFHSAKGSYKVVEVIDANFLNYFETKSGVDIFTSWDFDCGTFDPVPQYKFTYFDPATPATTFDRFSYLFIDVLNKAVRQITEGTVLLVSDFFTTGQGKNWVFATGQMLAEEIGNFDLPSVTWDDLTKFMLRSYRLVRYHYQNGGQQYVRIEPYGYFFNKNDAVKYEAVSSLTFGTNLDRLYSTTTVGDSNEIDPDQDPTFVDFEFNSFEEQTANVGGSCGSGSELDLTLSGIIVDTDKLEIALIDGTTDKTYEKTNFVIETDGTNAIPYLQGSAAYYNQNFWNSFVLRRWFSGVSPASVFPSEFSGINVFEQQQTGAEVTGNVAPGGNFAMQLFSLWFQGDLNVYNPDNVLSSESGFDAQVPVPISPVAPNITVYTCTKPADYRVQINWTVGMALGINSFDEPILMFANVRHEDAFGGFIADYRSPGVQVNDGQTFSNNILDWLSPNITLGLNERLKFFASSNNESLSLNAFGGGAFEYFIGAGSSVSLLPCNEFIGNVDGGDLQQIYEITFDGYPLCRETFDKLRENPGIRQIANTTQKEQYSFGGWVESLKFDLITRQTEIKLVSGDQPPFDTPANCWILANCIWNDDCVWIDPEIWCD